MPHNYSANYIFRYQLPFSLPSCILCVRSFMLYPTLALRSVQVYRGRPIFGIILAGATLVRYVLVSHVVDVTSQLANLMGVCFRFILRIGSLAFSNLSFIAGIVLGEYNLTSSIESAIVASSITGASKTPLHIIFQNKSCKVPRAVNTQYLLPLSFHIPFTWPLGGQNADLLG